MHVHSCAQRRLKHQCETTLPGLSSRCTREKAALAWPSMGSQALPAPKRSARAARDSKVSNMHLAPSAEVTRFLTRFLTRFESAEECSTWLPHGTHHSRKVQNPETPLGNWASKRQGKDLLAWPYATRQPRALSDSGLPYLW